MTLRYLNVVPRIPVRALAPMIDFYARTFGFVPGMTWPDIAPTFAILDRDEATLQFYVADDAARCGAVMLNVEVTDAMAVHAAVAGHVPVEWGPEVFWYGRREFAVRDPDGNLVIITERTTDPVTEADQ